MNDRRSTLDPDHLAELEEERDFLLRSLDDLEAERAAGDIDEADFEQLRDDYTVRASDVIRRIERQQTSMRAVAPRRSPARIAAWSLGLLLFAVGAGWLLAQAVGERGVNDQITGSIDASLRDRILDCQTLDQQGSISEANECYTSVLDEDPQNVEALTYKGWLLVRTAGSAQQIGADDEAAEILVTAKNLLDQAVAIDPDFADALAFRTIVFNAEGDTDAACAEYARFVDLDPPPFMRSLVDDVIVCP